MLRHLLLLSLLPAIALAEEPKAKTHQVKLNGHNFTLPDGFTIELAAKTPLVDRPIVAAFDEKGRLYVADSSGSNEKPEIQVKNPTHRIMRLEDTKGTGVFDKATVFADKMMFPEGVMWLKGSLYVGAPPHIWKLTDTNDDGVADKREIWFDGKTLTGCANDLHGPYLGPDGWIYWCKGAFAKQTHTLPNGKTLTTRAAHIFRARPDGSGIEPVMTGGMDNPVDVAFLPNGERFFTTTFFQHPGNGQRDGLVHAIYGGIYGKDHDPIYDPDHKWTSPNLMPVMTHLGPAAPCGLHCYESDQFGSEFTNNLFCTQFNLRKVSRHILRPSGSTYTTNDSDFVVSDNQDFHPTDVIEDADGSLLIMDTGGWYKLCCPSSQLVKADVFGAIYRVRCLDPRAKNEDPWGKALDWRDTKKEELVFRLVRSFGFTSPPVRRRASEALAALGDSALEDEKSNGLGLRFWLFKDPNTEYAQNWVEGIHVASRIDSPSARIFVREVLEKSRRNSLANDPGIPQAAIHSFGLWRDKKAVPHLIGLLKDKNAITRRMAAEALGRIGDVAAISPLLKALEAKDLDRTLEHSLTYALIEIGDPVVTSVGLKSENPVVRKATLIVLDQIGAKLDSAAVVKMLTKESSEVREAVRWIISRHPDWGPELSKHIRGELKSNQTEATKSELSNLLAQMSSNAAIQQLLGDLLTEGAQKDQDKQSKEIALAAMARSQVKKTPEKWIKALLTALSDGQLPAAKVLATMRALPAPTQHVDDVTAALLKVAATEKSIEVRFTALATVPVGLKSIDKGTFDELLKHTDRDQPAVLRSLAADILSRAKLQPDQLNTLSASLAKVGPLDLDRLLGAFGQAKDEAIGLKLVAALNTAELRPSLRVDGVKERIKHFTPAVQKAAEPLYAALNAELVQQTARLDEIAKSLKTGDIRNGQVVFNSTKTSCIACHTIGYVGGKIGPDLTRIGSLRTERDLLESVLFPSTSFVRSYEPLTVRLTDGRVFNGVAKKDAPDELVLTLAADKEVRISRGDIEEIQPGKVSIMPAGLDKQLTPQELADLIAFLRACK